MQMSNVGKPLLLHGGGGGGVGMVEREGKLDVLHGHPAEKKDSHLLIDLAMRTKDVIVAKTVIEEVRRRLLQFRGGESNKAEKEKLEKEAESKVEEKTRAAAWAWYQHGNLKSAPPPVVSPNRLLNRVVPHCSSGRKASRFKSEALKVGSVSGRVEPRWDFGTSLFDSYELDSVSKQIDHAFHENDKPLPRPARASQPRLTRSRSLRVSFPRSLCRSISDVVTQEEMALGDVKKGKHSKEKPRRPDGGWSFRKISKAINVLIQVPAASDSQAHEQHQLHLHEHHHHHQHEHEHHHHHHYSVRIKDASLYAVYR